MKKFVLPMLLFFSSTAFAQKGEKYQFRSFYELSKTKGIAGKVAFQFPLSGINSKHSMQYNNGEIVQLPLDKMPCLVPDVKGFNMPVSGKNASSNMPVLGNVPSR